MPAYASDPCWAMPVIPCCTSELDSRQQCCRPGLRSASSSSSYLKPRPRTKLGERAFLFFCSPAEWNSLLSELQMITDTTSLKRNLKYIFIIRNSVLTNTCYFSFSTISITYHFSCFYCNALLDFFSVSEAQSNFN